MDPRRFLSLGALALVLAAPLSGCALARSLARPTDPVAVEPARPTAPPIVVDTPPPVEAPTPLTEATARPYLEVVATAQPASRRQAAAREIVQEAAPRGRSAIAAANRSARAASSADSFRGGVQIFAWEDGRVYEVWTAPLRVTALTLAPGETVTAKAAGDTVRWQIGESQSGSGAAARTHVLIKPLQSGLETNLILTTSQRVYHLTLRSGAAEAFNAAIAWDYGFAASLSPGVEGELGLPPVDVAAVTPQGPLDARYRIEARGRAPRWAPTAVFNDGVRTFIALSPQADVDEAPALFVRSGDDLQLVNYRQADGLLIVDRVFDEAELRLGDRRPQVVRIRRTEGAAR